MVADERQPLLQADVTEVQETKVAAKLPDQWSSAYRWSVVALLFVQAFTVTFTCISVVPIAGHIVADLNNGHSDKSSSVLLVTIWELGEAAGPLLIAPLSEMYGRYPVFNVANVLFICGIGLSAWCQSASLFIFARFLTGCAVASNVLGPAIIGDIFPSEQRGTAMSYVMLAPLLGGAIGPAIAGTIAQTTGWRQVMYMALILAILCETAFLTLFRETYKVVIVKKNHALLRANGSADADQDEEDETLKKAVHEIEESALWASIVRPMNVLASSFVLQILSLYGALVFAFFYIMSTTLPDILQSKYNLPPSLVGSSFLLFSIGSCIGLVVCNTLLDRLYKRAATPANPKPAPESRLPLMLLASSIFPIFVALYGWAAEFSLKLPVFLTSVVLQGFGLMLIELPVMAYVVDAFGVYSASAMTAVLITRCLLGTFLPLVTAPLVAAVGYGWAFMLLAAACLVLAPVSGLVWRYGGKWRQRSVYTRDA
ncbi:MFS multidrug transporter-like protein [Aaosphaeria arxii CBS 175.79]|uniref:MFS multidrug transporter-like protein n=1 Tax=Aaosphaeria arxii CBS 175.79 TaxID=1450172 RepID=A0A6A5X7U3_9PLEO|nr:MFS multidrug transporter-like protein [Aaosphaeria arxii CBS 175.79]KAF2008976.1 MFS multidrug transporter-like protein [Aaosphaeria arxii CBS 175.79]